MKLPKQNLNLLQQIVSKIKLFNPYNLGKWGTPIILVSLAVLFLVVSIIINWTAIFNNVSHAQNKSTITSASSPQDLCSINNTITYSCYKKELISLTTEKGPEASLSLLKTQYTKNVFVKSECHQLTHVVGRVALAKYKDLGTTYIHGDYFCASGYFHGASEEIITEKGADYMINNAQKVCDKFAKINWHKLDHYNCVHGIGHGLLEATDGDLFKALKGCDNLNDPWERTSCYSGVFMQNVMTEVTPDESLSHKSAYLKDDDLLYPCTAVAEKYKWGCYIFQSSYAIDKTGSNFVQVFGLCSAIKSQYREVCYSSLGRDASGVSTFDQAKTIALCNLGPDDEAIRFCSKGAAINLIYVYHSDKQAYAYCDALSDAFRFECRGSVKDYYKTF